MASLLTKSTVPSFSSVAKTAAGPFASNGYNPTTNFSRIITNTGSTGAGASGTSSGSAGSYSSGSGSSGSSAGTAAAYTAPAASASTSAYDSIRSAYEAALENQRKARQAAYDAAVAAQRAEYNNNVSKVNDAADKALREAYINKMQSQRTMSQQMAAQGLNGGYSETTAAGMLNNYGNARNELETERSSQLNDLNITLQNNIAAARNILQNGVAGDYADYYTNLANLAANNPTASISTEQSGTGTTSGATLYQLYQQLIAQGATGTEAMNYLKSAGYNVGQLFSG